MDEDFEKPEEFGPEAFVVEDGPFDTAQDDSAESEKKAESLLWKVFRGGVSVVLILGLFYLFGFQNLFLYKRTSSAVEEQVIETKIDAEILFVPLNIIVLTTTEEGYSSKRDTKSVERIVENADRIWGQAGISLVIKKISFEEKDDALVRTLYQNPRSVVESLENFDSNYINVLLVGSLGGINGVSFGGLRAVAVADYTTVYDFRALAHEIGHQLGLTHVGETRGQLMYQGANGFNLSIEEIEVARNQAASFYYSIE